MATAIRVFFDTSVLFAGIWSPAGGARMLLRLSEASVLKMVLSSRVLEEIEGAFRRKAPKLLGQLAFVIDRCAPEIAKLPEPAEIERLSVHVACRGDAVVLAAACLSDVPYFVSLDREHILENSDLRGAVPLVIGTPGDCLAWLRERYLYPEKR